MNVDPLSCQIGRSHISGFLGSLHNLASRPHHGFVTGSQTPHHFEGVGRFGIVGNTQQCGKVRAGVPACESTTMPRCAHSPQDYCRGDQPTGLDSRTPSRGSKAGMMMRAVKAAVVIDTHMIMETCGWIRKGDSHRAVSATAIPMALAMIGRPARSIARRT